MHHGRARPAHRPALPARSTRVADELVARRLAERAGDAADRRRCAIHLTGKGRAALEAVHREAEELVSGVLLRRREEETAALSMGLRALLRVLHAPAGDGTPPVVAEREHDFPTAVEA